MKPVPSVAIVILNWNGRKFLEQFLPSVMASVYDNKRVIVADNASTDDSVAFVKLQYPQIEIIINNSNEGFAKGYNTALKQVQSDYYVLLNSDVEVTPNWIKPVIELMESNTAIAACQPKLLAYHNKTQFEYAGASGGWLDTLGYPFMRGRIFDICEEDKGQYNDAQPCFWASGAALFVRASVYHAMGGLDEYFFAHQEEIDLCWRMQLAGYKVYVQPASVVYHVGGGTLPKGNSRKTLLNFRNNLIMLFKNLSPGNALWKIPFRLGLDAVSAWQNLLKGDSGYFMAVLKAHLHFFKWLLFQKKQSVFPKQKHGKPYGLYKGLIVWRYFVQKKKTFSEIVDNK
ncbi:glycosyltransferase family 2 protein [Ferruginibacter sp. SUN106]|uniref:glycosyltransferase family 2 protein n=1 Tax=Ferruginibacter sp. SUN106 TaxID=2978348 RepID=UPI003D36B8EC